MNLRKLMLAYLEVEAKFNESPCYERAWILQDMRNLENEICLVILQPDNPYQFGDIYDLGDGRKIFIDADDSNRLIFAVANAHTLPVEGEL